MTRGEGPPKSSAVGAWPPQRCNIDDTLTLISLPPSTAHPPLEPAPLLAAGVKPDMIHTLAGLRHIDNILSGIVQVLATGRVWLARRALKEEP